MVHATLKRTDGCTAHDEQVTKLAGALETKAFKDGEHIIRQGEMGACVFCAAFLAIYYICVHYHSLV